MNYSFHFPLSHCMSSRFISRWTSDTRNPWWSVTLKTPASLALTSVRRHKESSKERRPSRSTLEGRLSSPLSIIKYLCLSDWGMYRRRAKELFMCRFIFRVSPYERVTNIWCAGRKKEGGRKRRKAVTRAKMMSWERRKKKKNRQGGESINILGNKCCRQKMTDSIPSVSLPLFVLPLLSFLFMFYNVPEEFSTDHTLLKIKVIYWHQWLHGELLTSMKAFHCTTSYL